MRVEFTPASRWDILEIADFIARDSRSAAFRYVELIETRCRSLNRMPNRFPVVFHLDPAIRQRTLGRHRVFYSVRSDHVLIERVLDASRDISTAAFSR